MVTKDGFAPTVLLDRAQRVLIALNAKIADDLLFLRAGGLTYTTILSMVPFLAVTFSVLKAFGIQNQLEPALARALEPLGQQGLEITRQIVAFVDNLKVGVLGAVGVAGLFYTAVSVVGQIEDSLNHVWRVRQSRNWGERFRDYLSLVLVGPVAVFAVLGLMATAESSWIVQRLVAADGLGWIVVVGTRMAPFLFLVVGFTVTYRFLPYTTVSLRAALVGGVTSALLWQFASSLFAIFVAGSTRYTAIYSGFAILILFLMWVYIGWLIVLVGGEVAYFCQFPRLMSVSKAGERERLRERTALHGLLEVARRHVVGEPPCAMIDLTDRIGAVPGILDDFVDECVRRGILLRSADPNGIALGRAPESIPMTEVFEVLQGLGAAEAAAASDPVDELLRERDRSVARAFEGKTVRSLIERLPQGSTDSASGSGRPGAAQSRA